VNLRKSYLQGETLLLDTPARTETAAPVDALTELRTVYGLEEIAVRAYLTVPQFRPWNLFLSSRWNK
jgi:hypothetical protein